MKSSRIPVVCAIIVALGLSLFAIRQYRRRAKTLERGQCTWYAFERARQAGWEITFDKPYGRHARAWWEKVTNGDRSSEPLVGSIMVLDEWPGNPYGHVGYVESVESPSKWTVSHANYPMGQPDKTLEGVPIFRIKCERNAEGVQLDGNAWILKLRGFIHPPGKAVPARNVAEARYSF